VRWACGLDYLVIKTGRKIERFLISMFIRSNDTFTQTEVLMP
jgi:hypothetical protein